MTVTYSQFMVGQMGTGFSWAGRTMGMVLLYNQPTVVSPGDNISNPSDHTPYDLTGLLNGIGWQEVDSAVASPTYVRTTSPVATSTTGGVTTVGYTANYSPIPPGTTAKQVYVAAAVFYIVGTVGTTTNPWVLITSDPFQDVVYPGFVVTGPVDPTSGLVLRQFFTYTVAAGVATLTSAEIVRTPGSLAWQSAREEHVYLIPQRVNYVPNPSFEQVGNFGWRSDGAMTRLSGGVDNPANHYVYTAGTILESLPIPASALFRFSAYVRSQGATKVNLGLVALDASYESMGIFWARASGNEWPLSTAWTRYDGLFADSADDIVAMIPHIEADGAFDCDLVLLENSAALHDYFDGDSQTGITGDFSWQGGAAGEAKSYSMYYTNRYVTATRLFSEYIIGQITKVPALVYDWVPTGTTIMTHWDVLSQFDTQHPLEDWISRLIP
jgi:hypothetical protein